MTKPQILIQEVKLSNLREDYEAEVIAIIEKSAKKTSKQKAGLLSKAKKAVKKVTKKRGK